MESQLQSGSLPGRQFARRPAVLATLALLVQLVLVIVGAQIAKVSPVARSSYVRFDSLHYLSIATGGYQIAYCAPDSSHTNPIVGEPRPGGLLVYCGNAGWFPGYSLLVRAVSALGVETVWAGMACSWVLRWLGLWAIASWLRRSQVEHRTAIVTMLAAAAFPGSIYYVAIFPLALTVLTLMLCIDGARRGSFWQACTAAFLTAFSYSSGWLGPTGIAGYLLLVAVQRRRWQDLGLATAIVGSALAGVLAVFVIQYWQTGYWQAYFLQASTFVHTFNLGNVVEHLRGSVSAVVSSPGSLDTAKDWQSVIVVALLLASAVLVLRRARAIDLTMGLCLAAGVAGWIFPKLMGESESSQVRYESLLLPLLGVFPMLPKTARWLFAVAFVVLTPFTAAQFFMKTIV
jgi:hypothetical protein